MAKVAKVKRVEITPKKTNVLFEDSKGAPMFLSIPKKRKKAHKGFLSEPVTQAIARSAMDPRFNPFDSEKKSKKR